MVTIKENGLLTAIIKHCTYIEEKTPGLTFDEFVKNEDTLRSICFSILQIGELTKHFDLNFTAKYNGVPWGQIVRMRDRIAHGYDTIKADIVWDTIQNDIVPLHNYCNQILEENK